MTNLKLSENLKYLRKRQGMSQRDTATAIGIAPATLSNYEKDKRHPDSDTLKKMALYFDVPIDWLVGNFEELDVNVGQRGPYGVKFNKSFKMIHKIRKDRPGLVMQSDKMLFQAPIINKISDSKSIYENENIEGYAYFDLNVAKVGLNDEVFFWRVDKDNMQPQYLLGDLVLIRRQRKYSDGSVILLIIGETIGLYAVFKAGGSDLLLISTNPNYSPKKEPRKDVILLGIAQFRMG